MNLVLGMLSRARPTLIGIKGKSAEFAFGLKNADQRTDQRPARFVLHFAYAGANRQIAVATARQAQRCGAGDLQRRCRPTSQ